MQFKSFECKEKERLDRLKSMPWKRWFAWHMVWCTDIQRIVWLEWVYYKFIRREESYMTSTNVYEYRKTKLSPYISPHSRHASSKEEFEGLRNKEGDE